MPFRELIVGAIVATLSVACTVGSPLPSTGRSVAPASATVSSGRSPVEPSGGLATVTLTESGCRSDIGSAIPAGLLELTLVNQTDSRTAVGLWRIPDGHTFAEVAAVVEEGRRLVESGKPAGTHPAYLNDGTFSYVEPGKSAALTHMTHAGTYAILCLRVNADQPEPLSALGPITVE